MGPVLRDGAEITILTRPIPLYILPINLLGYRPGFSRGYRKSFSAKVAFTPSPTSSTAKSAVLTVTFLNVGT